MNVIKRIWFQLVQTVLDAALGAVIRLRKTALPPKPIVWHDPRPYRRWRIEQLTHELERLRWQRDFIGAARPLDPDIDEVVFSRCLVLDEILTQRGLRDANPRVHGYN